MSGRGALLWLLWLGACGSSDIVVGGGPASGGVAAAYADEGPDARGMWTPLAQPSAYIEGIAADSPWLGRWSGMMSLGPSLQLDLRYSEQTMGAVGAVTFGQGPPPPPTRDPTIGYPPRGDSRHEPGLFHHDQPAQGFAYTVLSGRADGPRLRFAISLNQLWNDWCTLQPDSFFHRELGRYGCVPEDSAVGSGDQCLAGGTRVVDCDRLELCDSFLICVCWPNNCAADLSIVEQFELTLAPGSATASGTTSLDGAVLQLSRL